MRPLVIGILGGVASGKTTVAKMLGSLGAKVIDADEMAHELLERPEVKKGILERWGKRVLGRQGRVDRSKLASIVFSNGKSLKELTELLHPPIIESIRREVAEKSGPLVLDAALLVETELDKICDVLVFVEVGLEVKKERAWLRGWSQDEVQRREHFQLPESQKRQKAQFIVNNDSSEEETFKQLKEFWQRYVL